MFDLTSIKNSITSFKNLKLKSLLFVLFITINLISNAQLMFSEPFNETNGSNSGIDNIGGVNWTTSCPTCLDAGDYFEVDTVIENQLWSGKDPKFPYNENPLNPGLEGFGMDVSIICKTHYTSADRVQISKERI